MARDSYGSIRKEVNIFIESIGNYVAYIRDGGEWLWRHSKAFNKYKVINRTIDGSFLIISWISNSTRFGGSNPSIIMAIQTWRQY